MLAETQFSMSGFRLNVGELRYLISSLGLALRPAKVFGRSILGCSWRPMTDTAARTERIERYLKNAEEAEEHAAQCADEQSATLFRHVAERWRELVEHLRREAD